ncbi:MAG TPA: hypothetical protein VL443_05950 [Cyclobacteriaceae bacterium]|nr:hypothetical protein [Cyclobacteriaceae bacterium]
MKDSEKEDYIDRLIATKQFSELTSEELTFVMQELGGEEQYIALQKVHSVLNSSSSTNLTPRANTQLLLQERFNQQYAKHSLWRSLAFSTMPTYVVILLLAGGIFLTWMLTTAMQPVKTRTVMMASEKDTVKIVMKADTVFVNRVVYKYRRAKVNPVYNFVQARHFEIKTDSTLSVSMKEKEELDNLLVTGVN